MSTNKTTSQFIKEATIVHSKKYDYSLVKYKNASTKVSIVCPIHGIFEQRAADHLNGSGCPKCAIDKNRGSQYSGIINSEHGMKKDKSYIMWLNLVKRCYDNKLKNELPTYKECALCDEWKDYANFKKWFDKNYVEGYQLDKDILIKGNKLYSPETCCFVPKYINILFKGKKKGDGLPKGIKKNGNMYQARFTAKGIANYYRGETIEEAFNKYKEAKESFIKKMAAEYYNHGDITEEVYNAMMNYEIHITD